ncbi:hypothetical protein DPMN_121454 [Dreissena polymorpha]|uniref:Uncharacterized protein n=1 Tax=Dreissena polymorpha TaxID=45954 RepID=A0A9D4JPJ2_DREPO|nr:hypothetical protein DPMN_121454 [Dreissena polymorpha]
MLSMYCYSNQHDWDRYLQQVMMAYRSSVHASTGQTPNKMVFGHENILPLQALVAFRQILCTILQSPVQITPSDCMPSLNSSTKQPVKS